MWISTSPRVGRAGRDCRRGSRRKSTPAGLPAVEPAAGVLQPFIESCRAAADVSVRGLRHLEVPGRIQNLLPACGSNRHPGRSAAGRVLEACSTSEPAKQNEDQQNDNHQPEPATTVVAGAVERTAAHPLKPPSRMMIRMIRMIVPSDMGDLNPLASTPHACRIFASTMPTRGRGSTGGTQFPFRPRPLNRARQFWQNILTGITATISMIAAAGGPRSLHGENGVDAPDRPTQGGEASSSICVPTMSVMIASALVTGIAAR